MRTPYVALLLAAIAGTAIASPRETFTVTNQISNSPGAGGGQAPNANNTFTGGYSPKYIVLNGTLAAIAGGTFGFEAVIQVNTPGGQHFVLNPIQTQAVGNVVNVIYKIPVEVPDAAGNWNFRFFESWEDAAGDDSRWNTLTFTLDDGPPAAKDLGYITQKGRTRVFNESHAAGQVHWYKLTLPQAINSAAGTFLDIDTIGSVLTAGAFGANDTEIGLYSADGANVGDDDDSGGVRFSQLTYGAGTRPAEGGFPYDGRDGSLAPGVYYLAFGGWNTDFGATSWNATSTSSVTGTVNIRIRTNTGEPDATNLGVIGQPGKVVNVPVSPGTIRWVTFDIEDNIAAGNGNFLDLSTLGSSIPDSFSNADAEIGVYTASGNLVAENDDGGNDNDSQLSFGVGGRPAFGNGAPRDGQDGPLPAGRYFLAAAAFNTDFGSANWGTATTHPRTGNIRLNFITNAGAPTCPADLDDGSGLNLPDGGVTIDDLIFFLRRFENGC